MITVPDLGETTSEAKWGVCMCVGRVHLITCRGGKEAERAGLFLLWPTATQTFTFELALADVDDHESRPVFSDIARQSFFF